MPFDAQSFRDRHNKKLGGAAATKAAEMANAMIKGGTDEGIAIATANKHANAMQGKKKSRAQKRYGGS